MADTLGPIQIPEPPKVAAFPFRAEYGSAVEIRPQVITHLFDQPGLKTEQRFEQGNGLRRFRVTLADLICDEYEQLRNHFEDAWGSYAYFDYTHPKDQQTFETVLCRYEAPTVNFDFRSGTEVASLTVSLVEYKPPGAGDVYGISAVLDRFPSSALDDALLEQTQCMIPLVRITPRSQMPIYLSNRRATVGGTFYLPRLLDWSGIQQTLGETSDSASFTFGDADRVFRQYVNQISLQRALVNFSLYHIQTSIQLDLWSGYVTSWSSDRSGTFQMQASDGVIELNLAYPTRKISRQCWKVYKGRHCQATSSETFCNKSWADCVARNNTQRFGGIVITPSDADSARIRQEQIMGTYALKRGGFHSVTVANESVYDRVLQEVYTDKALPVVCDVAMGRDDNTFYAALGIVGEGPIGSYDRDLSKHRLDNFAPHDPQKGGGWRGVLGNDPVEPSYDWFAITRYPWNVAPPGATYAAGTAFAEIRKTDEEGLQLVKVSDRQMTVVVTQGLGGWTWTGPGARAWTDGLSNPVWLMVNVYLKAIGLRVTKAQVNDVPPSEMEKYFDVGAAVEAAQWCDQMVDPMPGLGTVQERQFPCRGILREQKPLKDWFQEICNTFLGYYTFRNAKLYIGIRLNSSAVLEGAFTRANILHNSLEITPVDTKFNHLTVQFGDEEFDYALNNVSTYDIDHATFIGTDLGPRFLPTSMNLFGVSNKSQAARIATTRLREELGGMNLGEHLAARNVKLRTTVLALGLMVGQVGSLDHEDMQNGRGEFRVQNWSLNSDFSIDVVGTPTTDNMYNMVVGPKPADELAPPVPGERFPQALGAAWLPNELPGEAGDPLYPPGDRSFALRQFYAIEMEGTYSPELIVTGEKPVNRFLEGNASVIRGIRYETTGGSLPGGQAYYCQVGQRDGSGNGRFISLSNIVIIWIPTGTNTNKIILDPVRAAETMPGYGVWVGFDPRALSQQVDDLDTSLPAVIEIPGPLKIRDRGAPAALAKRIRIKCKEVHHSGIAGILVTDVIAPNKIRCSDFINSADDQKWVGQIISIVADASDGNVPLWNFTITAFNKALGELTVSPDCVRAAAEDSVEKNDILIVRSRATSATVNSITNTFWKNSVGAIQFGAVDGLKPNEEIGFLIRIVAGTGRGQVRRVIANDNLTHTITPNWTVTPDTSSIYIVEFADWIHTSESSVIEAGEQNQRIEVAARVQNLQSEVVLVGGFLVDERERETYEEIAVYREIWIYGEPYQVRTTSGGTDKAGLNDQTIRVDTTTGNVTLELPALVPYFGRSILVVNDGTGATPGAVIIKPVGADKFHGGAAEIVLAAPGDWVEFVAGGDRVETLATSLRRQPPHWLGRRALQRSQQAGGLRWRHRSGLTEPRRRDGEE